MENENDIKIRILNSAREEFFLHGFTKVTVDEIASKLGMSKKTIYKFYPSKDDIVRAVITTTFKEVQSVCEEIVNNNTLNFVDKLQQMMTVAALHISKIGKSLIEDLQKNVPHVWNEVSEFRSKRINENFSKLLNEGVQKGIFRNDIDQQLVLLIYDNVISNLVNPVMLANLPFTASQVFEAIVKVIFEGIMTDKAKSQRVQK